jgi:photosystem II stability/assembly factor-like uncharacterized protein
MANIAEIITMNLHPENPLSIVASGDGIGSVIVSDDGGNRWQFAKGDTFQAWALARAPSDPSIMYASSTRDACIDENLGALIAEICAGEQNGLFRSKDAGQTWQQVNQEPLPDDGISTLAVHPQDPETVFGGTLRATLVKSEDGGNTWRQVSQGLPNTRRPIFTLAVDPSEPATILMSLEQAGFFRSTDGGQTWRQLSAGLDPEAPINDIVFDPTDSSIIYMASSFSGVHVSTDAGDSWMALNDGLTHRTANTLGISDDGTVLYVGIEGAGVYRLGTPPPVEDVDLPEPEAIAEQDDEPAAADDEPAESRPEATAEETQAEGQRRQPICPTSYFPLFFMAGLTWLRRRKSETS